MIIVAASEVGDDYVAVDFARLDFLLVAGLDVGQVVWNWLVQVDVVVLGVFVYAAGQAHIWVWVDEHFAVQVLRNSQTWHKNMISFNNQQFGWFKGNLNSF